MNDYDLGAMTDQDRDDYAYEAQWLCQVCEAHRATVPAQYCSAMVCADCASNEPAPDEVPAL